MIVMGFVGFHCCADAGAIASIRAAAIPVTINVRLLRSIRSSLGLCFVPVSCAGTHCARPAGIVTVSRGLVPRGLSACGACFIMCTSGELA
jgi:hypothetical protein